MKKKALKQELALAKTAIDELSRQKNLLVDFIKRLCMATLLSLDEVRRISCEEGNVKPIWVQDKEGTIWAAVLDHFTPDEDLAVYGLDLWFSTKTYGKDWVAWSKQPTAEQMKSVHLDGMRYMFGDKGEKL